MKRFFNVCLSLIMCAVIIINCNLYRRDVYAVVAAIPVIAVGGGIALKLTAAAVAAVAGIVVGLGITSDSGSASDNDKLIKDYLEYDIKTNGSEHTIEMLEDAGFVTEVEEDGSVVVDVPGSRIGTFTGYYSDGEFYFGDLVQGNGDLSGGSPPDPEDDGDGPGLGKRLLAGFMAVGSGLGSIGASFYDYLHNSDTVEYEPVFSADIGSFDEINLAYYNTQREMASSHLGYSFDQDSRDMKYYSLTALGATLPYEYYKFYYYVKPKGEKDVFESSYKDYYILVFAAIGYNTDGSYAVYNNSIYLNPYDTITHHFNFSVLSSASSDILLDNSYFEPVVYGGLTHAYEDGYLSLSAMTQAAYYINSSIVDIEDSELPSGSGTLKIGDTIYNITEGDNIYNNQQYITQQISDKQDSNGNVLITTPTIDRESNTISYPRYVTVEGDTITYLNPDTMDVEEDVQLSDEDYTNKNIFQLLYNFCNNFWTKCKQVLQTVFVPDLSGFYDIYTTFRSKFPIIDQSAVLLDKLLDYDYATDGLPSFLIKYKSSELDYETPEQDMVNFNSISNFLSVLHGIILFICYYAFCKKVIRKVTKVFQP